ncbi:MAG: glycosyltransferase family 4 protein, partial [Candidatus Paceibacterota bacterium]
MQKILICTQKVDRKDPILGFFHRWIEEFAKSCDRVTVICLQKGEYNFPKNVEILSLGKEGGRSRLKYLFNFYKYIWEKRKDYDAVFVHMNPEYIILGGLPWKVMGKRITLWYAHGKVNLKLRVAEKITDVAFASSASGFRLNSKKLKIVGQGIDTNVFFPSDFCGTGKNGNGQKKIVFGNVGRISKAKHIDEMVDSVSKALADVNWRLDIVGEAVTKEDGEYFSALKEKYVDLIKNERVRFLGTKTQAELPDFYRSLNFFVNFGGTGSMDKVALEAMACGAPVVSSNEAYKEMLDKYGL